MESSRVPRGPASRLVFLFVTLVLTVAATGLLCSAIMSDHWEEISWDKEDLTRANVNLTWYLNGQVARLESSVNHRNKHRVAKSSSFLVPTHGGIWIMCVSLSGIRDRSFYNVKLKPKTAHIYVVIHASGFKYIKYIIHDCERRISPDVFSLFQCTNYHYGWFSVLPISNRDNYL
ncbi:uncharacterized protein LOC112462702 [Temnothorax curvispinosus]|uniref:Uncharacterized protein LOC112462702 n=1 Tax=Temnothorax curvispinosus TaxID=300111 RepID=A0A6J1QR23_9HYME|nr:uncharacterized protein LOC112462702 [Temnothorax curvispinosus]